MASDKDIRFSAKKVDDSWKDTVERDKTLLSPAASAPGAPSAKTPESSKAFLGLLNSLAYQAMLHLGEIPHPQTGQPEPHPDAAREVLDLLLGLKVKTQGNRGREEQDFFETILPELQLKFSSKV